MSKIHLVVSNNDLGVDVHGAYTSKKRAEAARDKMNTEDKSDRLAGGNAVYYGNRHYIRSGPVNQEPSDDDWGDDDLTGFRKDRSDQ